MFYDKVFKPPIFVCLLTFTFTLSSCGGGSSSDENNQAPPSSGDEGSDNKVIVSPSNLIAVANDKTVNLSWDNVNGASAYSLYYSQESFANLTGGIANYAALEGGILIEVITSNSYIVPDLTDGVTYYFVVTATNASGIESVASNEVFVEKINQLTPSEVVNLYHEYMKNHNDRPDLPIYTEQTQEMLKTSTVTSSQMDNIASNATLCNRDAESILNSLAVVRYDVSQRYYSPYFLVLEDGMWRIDLKSMSQIIRFNNANQWRFDINISNPFSFGFTDWQLDENGYPHAPS